MRSRAFPVLLALLACAASAGCRNVSEPSDVRDRDEGGDTDSNLVSDTDADSDSDTGTGADTDTGADTEECMAEVSGVPEWGTACHTNDDCPELLTCITFGSTQEEADGGYCAPMCCDWVEEDPSHCTDQGTGDELCTVGQTSDGIDFDQPYFCAILCDDGTDCPDGTACTEVAPDVSLCYGYSD